MGSRKCWTGIDGLRAIAVPSVITFHYGSIVPRRFIGRDVFFVISGDLITSQLVREIPARTFSLLSF
ncbi:MULTISPECIES: hypothetical protein [Bradyrhizobium]